MGKGRQNMNVEIQKAGLLVWREMSAKGHRKKDRFEITQTEGWWGKHRKALEMQGSENNVKAKQEDINRMNWGA